MKTGEKEEDEQPEPEGYIDLVVEHVDRENTQTVKSRTFRTEYFVFNFLNILYF